MIRSAALCLFALLAAGPAWPQDRTTIPVDEQTQTLLLQGVIKASDLVRDVPLVGKLGRPEALVFKGVKSFPESQLRERARQGF